jgi:hypothetical protein
MHAKLLLTRAEDRATVETDPSADAGGQTAGRGLALRLFFKPAGGHQSDKLKSSSAQNQILRADPSGRPDIHLRHQAEAVAED